MSHSNWSTRETLPTWMFSCKQWQELMSMLLSLILINTPLWTFPGVHLGCGTWYPGFLQASRTEKLTPFILTASSYMRCTSILSLQMLRQEHFSGNTHSGPAPAFLFDHQTTQNAPLWTFSGVHLGCWTWFSTSFLNWKVDTFHTYSSYMRCTSILSLQMLRQEHFSGTTHSGPAPAFLFDHQTTQNAKPPKWTQHQKALRRQWKWLWNWQFLRHLEELK